MDTTGKVVEMEKYRKKEQRQKRQAASKGAAPPPERAVKEMAYYMLKALECAKQLL